MMKIAVSTFVMLFGQEVFSNPEGTTIDMTKSGEVNYISNIKHDGKEVIVVDNNITYLPKSMIKKDKNATVKKKDKPFSYTGTKVKQEPFSYSNNKLKQEPFSYTGTKVKQEPYNYTDTKN